MMTDPSPEREYAERLKQLEAALDEREKENERLHERTPAAIHNNLLLEEQRLYPKLIDARADGNAATEKIVKDKLDELLKTVDKQLAFERDRYAAETRAVEVERGGIKEMVARHEAERGARAGELAAAQAALEQRWIREESAVPPPVRDAKQASISSALDAAPAYIKAAEIVAQDAIEKTTGIAVPTLSDIVPEAVDVVVGTATALHERHLAILDTAMPPAPTEENLAWKDVQREMERRVTDPARKQLEEMQARHLEELERARARNEIER